MVSRKGFIDFKNIFRDRISSGSYLGKVVFMSEKTLKVPGIFKLGQCHTSVPSILYLIHQLVQAARFERLRFMV